MTMETMGVLLIWYDRYDMAAFVDAIRISLNKVERE